MTGESSSVERYLATLERPKFIDYPAPPIVLVPPESLTERCASLAVADVDADWLGELAAIVDDVPLLDSTTTSGLGADLMAAAAPADGWFLNDAGSGRSAGQTREDVARGLVSLVSQLDRVMAWAGAQQAAAMAALARPGVAVPVGDLLDAVIQGGAGGPSGANSAASLRTSDFGSDVWHQVSVSGDPAWDGAATGEAAGLASAEVGAQLAWTPATARARVGQAVDVVDTLPMAQRLWSQGRLDRSRVMALADRTEDLDPAARALVEEQLLADGGALLRSRTPGRVRVLVDRCVAALDPDAVRRRQERARQSRDVFVSPRDDGMSRFCADVPAPVAMLARAVIDEVAGGLSSDRSIGERRADVFADLFTRLATHGHVDLRGTGADGSAPESGGQECVELLPTGWDEIDAGVTVVVEASVLAGVDLSDPAQMEGALLASHPGLPLDLV